MVVVHICFVENVFEILKFNACWIKVWISLKKNDWQQTFERSHKKYIKVEIDQYKY